MIKDGFRVISGAAPSSATTAIVGAATAGLSSFPFVNVTATFAGNVGGTLDVYVQRYDPGLDAWIDWIHFPQRSAGAASATYYIPGTAAAADIYTVGTGTSFVLAADSHVGGHPGDQVRVYAVSGTSTSAGATVTVSFTGLSS